VKRNIYIVFGKGGTARPESLFDVRSPAALRMAKCSAAYSPTSAAHYSYADSGDPCGGNETFDITDVLHVIYSMLRNL
jgi:hypothetical protein